MVSGCSEQDAGLHDERLLNLLGADLQTIFISGY